MIHRQKFALTFGTFAAVLHLVWSIIVALGWGQSLMDFVYQMHFMQNPYMVATFSLPRAIGLIAIAFVMGYIISSVFALIWNKFHKA